MAKTGFVNGSDLLLYVDGKAVGSCTSHQATFNSETKDRATKPTAKQGITAGLWKKKGVTGLSYSISADGLLFYNETECGFKKLYKLWKAAKSIEVKCMERSEDGDTDTAGEPYLVGMCVITSLQQNAAAQDDATYSLSLENDGEPSVLDESKITEGDPGE